MSGRRRLAAVLVALVLTGMSPACTGDDPRAEPAPAPPTLPEDSIQLTIVFDSSDPVIAARSDQEGTPCDWGDSQYGVANVDDQQVATGSIGQGLVERHEVTGLTCRATIFVPAERSPSYRVSVAGRGRDGQGSERQWHATQTFRRRDLVTGAVIVVIQDPP